MSIKALLSILFVFGISNFAVADDTDYQDTSNIPNNTVPSIETYKLGPGAEPYPIGYYYIKGNNNSIRPEGRLPASVTSEPDWTSEEGQKTESEPDKL